MSRRSVGESESLFGATDVPEGRITRRAVPALYPAEGSIHTVLIGEAPGPRGADQSLIPFWGDNAGRLVYRALADAGCAWWDGPPDAFVWPGRDLAARGIYPRVRGVLLTNAFNACPTDDGQRFRAPKRSELLAPANVARLRGELALGMARGCLQVVTLGRVAAGVVTAQLAAIGATDVRVVPRPHPSAQGLLMTAPNKGAGLKLADLEAAWIAALTTMLTAAAEAGAPRSPHR